MGGISIVAKRLKEARLRAAYPHAEIIIHQDPEGVEEPRSNFPRRVGVQ